MDLLLFIRPGRASKSTPQHFRIFNRSFAYSVNISFNDFKDFIGITNHGGDNLNIVFFGAFAICAARAFFIWEKFFKNRKVENDS